MECDEPKSLGSVLSANGGADPQARPHEKSGPLSEDRRAGRQAAAWRGAVRGRRGPLARGTWSALGGGGSPGS